MKYIIIVWVLMAYNICQVGAKIISRSEKTPEWVRKGEAGLNARRSNDTYYFKIIRNSGAVLEELKKQKLGALSIFIGQYNQISGQAETSIQEVFGTQERQNRQSYAFKYVNDSQTDVFYARLVDEYWEYISYPEGTNGYEYYALFAVSRMASTPVFDDISFSTNYGMQGFTRSLIPGWGQMYKGSMTKGLCILSGEVVCVAGIIVSESLRSSYVKKMKEQPKFAKDYNSKADNWENGRNICIGAAAALYVYNLIDAIAAKGAKRVVVKQAGKPSFSLSPAIIDDGCGLTFAYRF